jgi:cardiolipin synthase
MNSVRALFGFTFLGMATLGVACSSANGVGAAASDESESRASSGSNSGSSSPVNAGAGQTCYTTPFTAAVTCAKGLTCVPSKAGATKGVCESQATDAGTSKDTGSKEDADTDDASDANAATSSFLTSDFYTPSSAGQAPVIDAIASAKTSIRMMMFHLTVTDVVDALATAAKNGVDVRLIIDNGNWTSHTPASIKTTLKNAGVVVTPSSTGFRITHTKTLVIDGAETLVMSLNLTSPFATTRDYAVVTQDPEVASEFLKVFNADVANAASGGDTTPALDSESPLLWSPVNSQTKLLALVGSASKSIIATSENWGDPDMQNAFIAAATRGVSVRVIGPLCDQNTNPLYDIPSFEALNNGGVQARAMPSPATATDPYMHAKMMIVDGVRAYVGSMNYSTASLSDAREVGIIFSDAKAIKTFEPIFEQDWAQSSTPPASSEIACPSTTSTLDEVSQ